MWVLFFSTEVIRFDTAILNTSVVVLSLFFKDNKVLVVRLVRVADQAHSWGRQIQGRKISIPQRHILT